MRLVQSTLIAAAVGASLASLTTVATASTVSMSETTSLPGQVVAFTHEFTELKVWNNPKGCQPLPAGTHLIFNQTDKTITIYADPLCVVPIDPFSRVKPGYGTHVSAVGSFSA
ncbi:hypothetical protein SAMN05192558_111262 [Actinokineospora alba]|uniref:Uncharacterized protein n=1 Tax=Actinokineospora alba TaxID=504798 RepID=A0A1H0UKQ8_9PSEU|nr:hypothetical protein [Actinokineospora alba]TDP65017.1 hypothetical protein C8E96_0496 [Actinokineospora alba]SDH52050.1 hypothetical protein SAMN05421871_101319 [Actinokineospora alba]SDP66650.1 hypothetical protein SAMN05192558_111262 [Actinokineospora alba]